MFRGLLRRRGSSSASPQDSGSSKRKVQQVNDFVYELYKPEGIPTLQVLFFHGLRSGDLSNAHISTWKSADDSCIWPQEWLPDVYPSAHIFVVSYSACAKLVDMFLLGENLVSDLLQVGIGQMTSCPVILVGHCVGGLVVKQICCQAHDKLHENKTLPMYKEKLGKLLGNIRGFFYYSTPHHGSSIIAKAADGPLFQLFKTLNGQAERLNFKFEDVQSNYKWLTFGLGECLGTTSSLFNYSNVVVVPEASSRQGDNFLIVVADHISICQPTRKMDKRFSHLAELIDTISIELETGMFSKTSGLHDRPGGYVVVGDSLKTTHMVSATSNVLGSPSLKTTDMVSETSNVLGSPSLKTIDMVCATSNVLGSPSWKTTDMVSDTSNVLGSPSLKTIDMVSATSNVLGSPSLKTTDMVSATSNVLGSPDAHCPIVMGSYETNNDCSEVSTGGKNSAIIYFNGSDGESSNSIPMVLTGLNMLDMRNNDENIRVGSFADEVSRDQFSIHFNSWADTTLYNAKASWLRLASATSSGILAGTFKTTEGGLKVDRRRDDLSLLSTRIRFGTTFPTTPTVFVGFSGFCLGQHRYIAVEAKDCRCDSFQIMFRTFATSDVFSAEAMWVAFPPDFDVRAGGYEGNAYDWSGSVDFHPAFPRTPEVFTAFTIVSVLGSNFMARLNAKAVSESRMDWSIEQSGDVFHFSAGYFAVCV